MSNKLEVTLKRSVIGRPEGQKQTAQALGLNKIGAVVTREDTQSVRGMVDKISHLVTIKEV